MDTPGTPGHFVPSGQCARVLQGHTVSPRLAWNSQPSRFSLLSVGMADVCHCLTGPVYDLCHRHLCSSVSGSQQSRHACISVCWAPPMHRSSVSLCLHSFPFPFYQSAGLCSHTSTLPAAAGSVTGVPPSVSFGVLKVSRHTAQASVPLNFLLFYQILGPCSHPLSPHLDSVSLLNRAVTLLPACCPALAASFDRLVT